MKSPSRSRAPRFPSRTALLATLVLTFFPATAHAQNAHLVLDIHPGSGGSFDQGDGSAVDFTRPVALGAVLLFAADDGTHGTELWRSDGTAEGTALVKDIHAGGGDAFPDDDGGTFFTQTPAILDGVAYFAATSGGNDYELWRSDGTADGTWRVRDVRGGSNGSFPSELTVAGETLYFFADDGIAGEELWASDGTAAGTYRVADLQPGPDGCDGDHPAALAGVLYFAADDGVHGTELWRSDGTAGGTWMVDDLLGGTCFSAPCSSRPRDLTPLGGLFFFSADTTAGSGFEENRELWKSDGTAAGTRPVKDIAPGDRGSWPSFLTPMGGLLYFQASDDTVDVNHGEELWVSDGTAAGTRMVKDIWNGSGGSFPRSLTAVDETLFFAAATPDQGGLSEGELWRSDGTEAGTVMVDDTWPGTNPVNYDPDLLTAGPGLLFFRGRDPDHGWELWLSDGTATGTLVVQEIDPGTGFTDDPGLLTVAGGALFFRASDDAHGRELWRLPISAPLWSQTDDAAGVGKASQEFEAGFADFDCWAADDFAVPAGEPGWDVGRVNVGGAYDGGGGPAPLVDVEILADGGGVPGAALCAYPDLAAGADFGDASGDYRIVLPEPCTLTPGSRYWLAMRADMDFGTAGQWYWGQRTTAALDAFAWKNPGDGFATGCTDWTPLCGSAHPALLFSLGRVPGCLTVLDLELGARTVTGEETFSACSTLSAGDGFTVATGGDATLRAGERVVLEDGFTVDRDARLTVELTPGGAG